MRKIAKYFDNPVLIADNREYVTYTGTIDGIKVSVTSTGIGGPSASIAMEELYKCGADTFIRIGTCGGIQTEVIKQMQQKQRLFHAIPELFSVRMLSIRNGIRCFVYCGK